MGQDVKAGQDKRSWRLTKRELSGTELLLSCPPRSAVVQLLGTCFPNVRKVVVENDPQQVLQEGIGFHNLRDTRWLLFFSDDSANDLMGLVTAIDYHNGLYLCNFCVAPPYRNQGHGLEVLQQTSRYALQRNKHRLIGNANVKDRTIVRYYKALGATAVETGLSGGNETPPSSIRLERRIPDSAEGIDELFKTLRQQRRYRRQRQTFLLWTVALTSVASLLYALMYRRKGGTKHKQRN